MTDTTHDDGHDIVLRKCLAPVNQVLNYPKGHHRVIYPICDIRFRISQPPKHGVTQLLGHSGLAKIREPCLSKRNLFLPFGLL